MKRITVVLFFVFVMALLPMQVQRDGVAVRINVPYAHASLCCGSDSAVGGFLGGLFGGGSGSGSGGSGGGGTNTTSGGWSFGFLGLTISGGTGTGISIAGKYGTTTFGGPNGLISTTHTTAYTTATNSYGKTMAQLDGAKITPNPTGSFVGYNSLGYAVYSGSGHGLEAGVSGGSIGNGRGIDPNPTLCPSGTQLIGGRCVAVTGCNNPVYTKKSCNSAPNQCGQTSQGVEITCSNGKTICSAITPPVSSSVGKPCSIPFINTCGVTDTAYGITGCTVGSCNITTYPPVVRAGLCKNPTTKCSSGAVLSTDGTTCVRSTCPAGTTQNTSITDRLVCTPNTLKKAGVFSSTITVSPSLAKSGDSVTITWKSAEASSCSVTSDRNSDSWTGTTGRKRTSGITTKMVYTLNCKDRKGVAMTPVTTTIRIVPNWREI